jgi:hypothetical protein
VQSVAAVRLWKPPTRLTEFYVALKPAAPEKDFAMAAGFPISPSCLGRDYFGGLLVSLLDFLRELHARGVDQPLSTETRHIDGGRYAGDPATLTLLKEVLIPAGVEFIDEDGGGPGVRLRKPSKATSKK